MDDDEPFDWAADASTGQSHFNVTFDGHRIGVDTKLVHNFVLPFDDQMHEIEVSVKLLDYPQTSG